MDVCLDYEDLFKILNTYNIRYLVVGAHAVIYYTEPRYSKDIDVWVIPELNQEKQVFAALKDFGAPLRDLSPEDFKNKSMILQIGVAPVRIDILFNIEGVSFQTAWDRRKKVRYGTTSIYIFDKKDLILSKQAAGRPQDKLDLAKLNKVEPKKKPLKKKK